MLKLKIDVLQLLNNRGYSTYRIRQENIISQSALTGLRSGKMLPLSAIDNICKITGLQPGDIIEWIPDNE